MSPGSLPELALLSAPPVCLLHPHGILSQHQPMRWTDLQGKKSSSPEEGAVGSWSRNATGDKIGRCLKQGKATYRVDGIWEAAPSSSAVWS